MRLLSNDQVEQSHLRVVRDRPNKDNYKLNIKIFIE